MLFQERKLFNLFQSLYTALSEETSSCFPQQHSASPARSYLICRCLSSFSPLLPSFFVKLGGGICFYFCFPVFLARERSKVLHQFSRKREVVGEEKGVDLYCLLFFIVIVIVVVFKRDFHWKSSWWLFDWVLNMPLQVIFYAGNKKVLIISKLELQDKFQYFGLGN